MHVVDGIPIFSSGKHPELACINPSISTACVFDFDSEIFRSELTVMVVQLQLKT